jgi:predicted transcriptional regulator
MTGAHDLSGRFLTAYNQLDDCLRKEFDSVKFEPHSVLLRKKAGRSMDFKQRLHELSRFAELRNSIVHWHGVTRDEQAIAEPHLEIVARYERLVQSMLKPLKAHAVTIPMNTIYTTTLDHYALSVIRDMHAKVYTHVPVMEDKRLFGVFSENTILSYLAVNEIVGADPTIKIREFRDFIPLRAHKSETFKFIPRNASLAEVTALFRESLQNKERLGAVFMTTNGKETEDVLGMITAWDVAGVDPASGSE